MLKKVAIVLGVVVAGILAFAATRPDTQTITRSVTSSASAEVLFGLVDDYHHFGDWSPWEKLDPAMARKFEGEPKGKGSAYYWKGNDKVGEGRMTNLGGTPNQHIDMKLDFIAPMPSQNETTFDFKPAGTGTAVTWTAVLHLSFMAKVAGIFMDMDKMVGGDFQKGLEQLKTVAEAEQVKVNEAKRKAEEEAAKAKAAADAAAAAAAQAAAAAPPAPAAPAAKAK